MPCDVEFCFINMRNRDYAMFLWVIVGGFSYLFSMLYYVIWTVVIDL